MSIVLINNNDGKLVALDTEKHADYKYTADDHYSWRDEPVAKLVAQYQHVNNPDFPSFTGERGESVVIDSVTVSKSGDIYGNAYSTAFTKNGVDYPAGEYLVKLVSAGEIVTSPENDVHTVPYKVEPVVNDDGHYIRGNVSQQNTVSFVDVGGKEYLIASNSFGDSYASAKESTNLLIDTETGKSTSIMLDNNGDGVGDKPFDTSPNPYKTGTYLPTTGDYDYNDLELIQNPQTGQYYALVMTTYYGASYLDRYEVEFKPNPDDLTGPPEMTIDTKSKSFITVLYSDYRGFSINDDGSINFIPGATANDYGMIKVQRLVDGDKVYDTFVDFAVSKADGQPRVIEPYYDHDLAYRIRVADFGAPANADAANNTYLNSSDGGLTHIPLVDYPKPEPEEPRSSRKKRSIDFGDGGAPCFTAGTLIATSYGDKLIEDLTAGDQVITLDCGFMPVRWVGRRQIDAALLAQMPNLRPIRIRAGALGHGFPLRDLLVSQQHRMLISSRIAMRMFSAGEVLVAAKHLLDCEGIEVANDVTSVTYFHFMCDSHAVVLAEGSPSESLLPGPMARQSLGPEALEEIYTIFPSLREGRETESVRNIVTGRQGRQLALRHAKNGVALYGPNPYGATEDVERNKTGIIDPPPLVESPSILEGQIMAT